MNNEGPYRVDYELLGKHLAGECSPEEQVAVAQWLAEDIRHQSEYDALAQMWQASSADTPAVNVDAAWDRVQARVAPNGTPVVPLRPPRRTSPVWIAAAALVVVAIGLALFLTRTPAPPEMLTVVNGEATPVDTRLPDGTLVTLRPGASLTYSKAFDGNERKVRFSGEGYFDVARQVNQPFVVDVGGAEVRVLGTEFNLREEAGVVVQVTEGKVLLKAGDEASSPEAILTAGQVARYDQAARKVESLEPLGENDLFWRDQTLRYDQTPLAEVAEDLAEFYEIKLQFENPTLGRCRLNAVFQDEPIESILEVIATSMNLEIQQNGTTVTLLGETCQP